MTILHLSTGMSGRARAYCWAAGGRDLLLGLLAIVFTSDFDSPAYDELKKIRPVVFWGYVFIACGIFLGLTAIRGRASTARAALICSATIKMAWAAAFLWAWLVDDTASPFAFVLWSSMAVLDLIICRQPLRTPFEDLVAEYVDDTEG